MVDRRYDRLSYMANEAIMIFTFLFHDNKEIVFEAEDCKHYTGHAALTNATVLKNNKNGVAVGSKFKRFNVALNSDLFGMFPDDK